MAWIWISVLIIQAASFCFFVLFGLWVQRRQWRAWSPGVLPDGGVSVILPIKGLDPGAADHYRAWLTQRIRIPVEVIFSLQDSDDPAIPMLEALLAKHRISDARILVNPVRKGLNGKSSNLYYGVEAARYPYLVMADSDIIPTPDLLRRMVPSLLSDQVGLVACLAVVRRAANLSGGMTALALNLALTGHWAPMHFLKRDKDLGASGACFAIRKDVLADIGGVAAFGGHITEDAEMARQIMATGRQVVLGPAVALEQGEGTWNALFGLLSRGAYVTLFAPSVLTTLTTIFALFLHLLILTGALLAGHTQVVKVALACWLARTLVSAYLQLRSDPKEGWRFAWVGPLVELAFLATHVRSWFTNRLQWRGVTYRVLGDGRVVQDTQ